MDLSVSTQFTVCRLSEETPDLFGDFVREYSDIVQLAVRQTVSATDRHVFAKIRALARQAGEHDAVPQDLIAVHLSALAILVKTQPQALVKACIRHSRLLLVKMVGELAIYYRDQVKKGTVR
jgi:hypothetical protein